jgi:hypothetical protein
MRKIVCVLLIFILQSCASSKNSCNNIIVSKFEDVFSERKKLAINKNDLIPFEWEEQGKKNLLTKICDHLQGEEKILIVEKVPLFDPKRFGIIYLYKQDKLIYFSQSGLDNVQIGKKEFNFEPLEKILSVVKSDFFNQASQVAIFFDKLVLMDAPSLNLLVIDTNDTANTNPFYGFVYAPQVIMSEEFDNRFSEK